MQPIAVPFLLAVPWLNFYAMGPTPHVWPWLSSAMCATVWYLFGRGAKPEFIPAAWLLAAACSAVIGLLQYFDLEQGWGPWISQARPGEAFANLRQRNQFATLTSIGLLALIGWLGRQTLHERIPLWAYLTALVLALGNAASGSRTGLLQWGLIVMLTIWWVLPRRRLVVFAVGTVLVYGLALFVLPWVLNAVLGLANGGLFARMVEPPTCASRIVLWSNVVALVAEEPWSGWGWGELAYAHYITLFPDARFCEILDNAHNLPLHLAVELGIPAALIICIGLLWIVKWGQPWRETDPLRQLAWGVLAVIGLHSMLEYPLWYGPFQLTVGMCIFLLLPVSNPSATDVRGGASVAFAFRGLMAALVLMGLAYTAWDYHRISQIYLAPQARDAAYRDDTLNKIRGSKLFRNQMRFAELTTTPLTNTNAQWTFDTATALLHYSPEPRVIEKVIESAVMLGRDDEALLHLARYRAAFPGDYEKWRHANGLTGGPAD